MSGFPACLNFTQHEKTEELYLPDNSVIRSEQGSSSLSSNTDAAAAGVPGLQANVVPGNTGGTTDGGARNNQKQQYNEKTMK